MTQIEEKIIDYVNTDLEYLNLTDTETKRYIQCIKNLTHHLNYKQNTEDCNFSSYFEEKFEEVYTRFILEGHDQPRSLELAKKAVLFANRKEYKIYLDFLRNIDLEEDVLMNNVLYFRRRIENSHARKKYLVKINDTENQNMYNLIKSSDNAFEKKFSVNLPKLINEYQLTTEVIQVWAYLASLDDNKLEQELKITREQLSMIYPTTIEEVSTLKTIADMKEEEITEKYGITRKELLQKYPLNNDTLKALKSIKLSSDKAIESTFHKSRQEIIHLRTITTDMIRIAQKEKMALKRKVYTKEELVEKFKTMKKGTYPNG